jgi:cell division control protein 6
MDRYDDLFAATRSTDSVFADTRALDPFELPPDIVARVSEERTLATLLNGVHEGYLPPTVSIYGPPGTGKTLTTRRVCEAFAVQTDQVACEYVNLKECRSLFSVANEIHYELTGERKGAYEGLDGVFAGIWKALESYPEWTVLLLDEIDHVRHDRNFAPSEFFYRLLRGEGRLKREVDLSVWLVSNELLEVDLRLDSRVQSVLGGEEVFFAPYAEAELRAILEPRIAAAFGADVVSEEAFDYGVREAANRWGDARKALTLFRHAGETANERGLSEVTHDCVAANLETTEKEAVLAKLERLPLNHLYVLSAAVSRRDGGGAIKQPVTTAEIHETLQRPETRLAARLGQRAIREVVADLETMGLLETWIDARGRGGRVKLVETTFDPAWVREAQARRADTQGASPDEADPG